VHLTTIFRPGPLAVQRQPMSVADVKSALVANRSPELADHLLQFGDLMLNEVTVRSGSIETKALSVMGWAAAITVFLVVGTEITNSDFWRSLGFTLTAIAAIAAAVFGFQALRVRKWTWPSQQDWFRSDLFAVDLIRIGGQVD
jgi:hypothetical protein